MDDGVNRLRFEPELEREFVLDHARRSRTVVRVFYGVTALIVLVGGLTHITWQNRQPDAFFAITLGLVFPICLTLIASTFAKTFAKFYQPLILMGLVAIGGGLLYIWYNFPNQGFLYYGSLSITLLTPLIYTISRLRFYWALIAGWTILAAYYVCAKQSGIQNGITEFQPTYVLMSNLFSMLAGYYMERATRRDFQLSRLLEAEKQKSELLLSNVLPEHVSSKLKEGEGVIADYHEDVSVLFADIVDFTRYASNHSPENLVLSLDRMFSEFDALAEALGIEKIKTIGDAYMAVSGLPEPKTDDAERIVQFALQLNDIVRSHSDFPFQMRIGIHCGPVVAGVIGRKKLIYDLWGDTVNTASRIETAGEPGMIYMSEEFADRVNTVFNLTDQGLVPVKGKGNLRIYSLALGGSTSCPSPSQS